MVGGGPTLAYQFGRGLRGGIEASVGLSCDANCSPATADNHALVRGSTGVTWGRSPTGSFAARYSLAWTPAIPETRGAYLGLAAGASLEQRTWSPVAGVWATQQIEFAGSVTHEHTGPSAAYAAGIIGLRFAGGAFEAFVTTTLGREPAGYYRGGD